METDLRPIGGRIECRASSGDEPNTNLTQQLCSLASLSLPRSLAFNLSQQSPGSFPSLELEFPKKLA